MTTTERHYIADRRERLIRARRNQRAALLRIQRMTAEAAARRPDNQPNREG